MHSNTSVGVADTITATTAAVDALVASVQHGELRGEGHDELSALLRDARAAQARLDYVVLATVREVDVRGSYVAEGALTAGAWARMHTRMTPAEASSTVRSARVLDSGELFATTAALAAGEISAAHVRAITSGVADAPAGAAALIEPEALAVAREADPRSVAALMKQFAHALDPDGADERALLRHERRGITFSPTPDGTVHIRGLADEVTGALLMTAIDTANRLVSGDNRNAAQQRIDALADIARSYLNSPEAPMSGGGHAHLVLTTDVRTLVHDTNGNSDTDEAENPAETTPDGDREATRRLIADALATGLTGADALAGGGAGPGGTLCWVGPVTGSTARRVSCDADVTFVSIDEHGQAQVVGRQQRFFTWAQRKAMIARDGDRCAVPFCDRPITWADAHHRKHWANGGLTTIDNGVLLCAKHHTLCHEGGWTLRRERDGRYLFLHRDGRTIGPEAHRPGHNRPPHRRH